MSVTLPPLEIANIVFRGSLPFKKPFGFREAQQLVAQNKNGWLVVNDETCPILQTKKVLADLKANHKPRKACISIFPSGCVTISGAVSRDVAEGFFLELRRDFRVFLEEEPQDYV